MDNRELSFTISIDGLSNENVEFEKLGLWIKNIKDEMRELEKLAKKGFASQEQLRQLASYRKELETYTGRQKELKKVMDTAEDSVTRMRAKLSILKQEYYDGDAALRQKLLPQINKLTTDVSKAEKAIGVHSRGVGNYKGALLDAGKQLIGFTSITAIAIAALNKMKEAFKQTEEGAKFFSKATDIFKTIFQGIISGDNIKDIFKNTILAANAADELNEIRKGDREDLVVIAKLEAELNALRLKGADVTKSVTEQLKYQNLASIKEGELIKYKIKDKQEELDAVRKALVARKTDTDLLLREAQLEAEIINISAERSLRIESKKSALRQKEIDEEQKKFALIRKLRDEEEESIRKNHENIVKLFEKKWEDLVNQEKLGNSLMADVRKLLGISDKDLGLQVNEKILSQNKKQAEAAESYSTKLTEENESKKLAIKQAAIQGAEMGADAAFASKRARMQAEMNAELSNQNLTEQQRASIRKKYAKEQQKVDVQQAIINTALAIGNALTSKPFFPMAVIGAALAAIQGGLQVATIKAAKFASGGKINRGVPINTGTVDDTLIAVNKTETVLTQRHVAALGGSGVMRRIGVPGYANGGYIGQSTPEIMPSGYSDLINAINSRMDRIEVTLDTNKVRSSLKEVDMINTSQRI